MTVEVIVVGAVSAATPGFEITGQAPLSSAFDI